MESFFLVIVAVLFLLAISDLIVGVSNDAVNFLNSAIGSKAAPLKIILSIAAIGVLVGATFSSGMMEVARKGIFHPDQFTFTEIMILFTVVMITDILLLDLFNTIGLPTSTTVSIVFELLGAAVGLTIIKLANTADGILEMGNYINSGKALAIITGILLSIVIAFSVGSIVQYITRIIFSFNYSKTIKYFGSIWGGLAISAIVYFILIKGAKGSSFLSDEAILWIKNNSWTILAVNFVTWTIVLQLLVLFFKTNILKVIILVGTFALAMAFAGNDLVNFIGVPLAGFESFKAFVASGSTDPTNFTMEILREPVKTPTLYLLIAGLIMVITLYLSKKARSVTRTEINLTRQDEGEERFQSSLVARSIVRVAMNVNQYLIRVIPKKILKKIENRFTSKEEIINKKSADIPAFDHLRASVNLVIASILITIGTNLKLPLSTTYVTFMVAMGTSLADGAWGRESAVYRISGVLTVVGGWFFTALVAFTASFIMAVLIYYGGIIALGALLILTLFLVYKSHRFFTRKEKEEIIKDDVEQLEELNGEHVFNRCNQKTIETMLSVSKIYELTINYLIKENRKHLKKLGAEVKLVDKETLKLKNGISNTIRKLEDDCIDTGHYFVMTIDHLRDISNSLKHIHGPCFHHVNNNHAPMNDDQVKLLIGIQQKLSELFNQSVEILKSCEFDNINQVETYANALSEEIKSAKIKQIKSLKKGDAKTKASMLFLDLLNETKNITIHIVHLLKAESEFMQFNKKNGTLRQYM